MSNAAPTPALVHEANPTSKSFEKLRSGLPVLTVLSIAGTLCFTTAKHWDTWLAGRRQETDDAQVRADVTPLSTKDSGIVARVLVGDFQRVKAGQLLVQLRDDDFRAQVELAEAAVASQAALENLKSQRKLQGSRIAAAHAHLQATKPDVERAQPELTREQTLESAKVSTKQRLEVATADRDRSLAQMSERSAELDAQQKQLGVLLERASTLPSVTLFRNTEA